MARTKYVTAKVVMVLTGSADAVNDTLSGVQAAARVGMANVSWPEPVVFAPTPSRPRTAKADKGGAHGIA